MAGGGLALMIVPLADRRHELACAVLDGVAPGGPRRGVPTLAATGLPRIGHAGRWVVGDRRLLPIGVLQAATFGLAVVAGNWVVTLLERQGASSTAAGLAGGLVLFIGILTRPFGGVLAGRVGAQRIAAAALVGTSAGALLLGDRGIVRGVHARAHSCSDCSPGCPFAVTFAAAQRIRPDAPGGRDRARQRLRRSHHPRRDAARRARVRAARRRTPRLRGDRRAQRRRAARSCAERSSSRR